MNGIIVGQKLTSDYQDLLITIRVDRDVLFDDEYNPVIGDEIQLILDCQECNDEE